MKSKLHLYVIAAFAVAVTGLQPFYAATTVFTEDFAYDGWSSGDNKMNEKWTAVVNTPALRSGSAEWPDTYLRLNNSTVYTNLSNTVTDDFSLTVTMFCESYGRSNWFAITDVTGTSGYYIRWDGGNSDQSNGQGRVQIGKISAAIAGYQTNPGTQLASLITSGHTAAGDNTISFASITLSWIAESGSLTLFVDGIEKQSVTDVSFSSFSRIYLSGNANGLYGSVNLSTIPESASTVAVFAIAGLLSCAIWGAKRRKAS